MSPNEAQLRAALKDGEGDSPDAGLVIANVRLMRRDRRRRVNAIAGGIAAVTVGTTLVVALTHTGGRSGGSSSNADSKAGAAYSARSPASSATRAAGAAGAALPAAASSSATPASAAASSASAASSTQQPTRSCPARPDRLLLPGGGGSGQFGSTDPLFAGTVSAMTVCAYPLASGAKTSDTVLSGAAARRLASTLDAAPAARSSSACPAHTDFLGGTIEILGTDTQATALKPVVITLGCGSSQATNGTSVRYLDTIPDALLKLVASPGRLRGSPVRS